jgi:hypothetical protein
VVPAVRFKVGKLLQVAVQADATLPQLSVKGLVQDRMSECLRPSYTPWHLQ